MLPSRYIQIMLLTTIVSPPSLSSASAGLSENSRSISHSLRTILEETTMPPNKDPSSMRRDGFKGEPHRPTPPDPDKERLALENELRERNKLYDPNVQWLLDGAEHWSPADSRWALDQLGDMCDADRIEDKRSGDPYRPLAPPQLLSQGEIHLATQVDGTPFLIPRRALSRGFLVVGPQGGGKTRLLLWLLMQLNAARPPIHWFIIDPKNELEGWAEPLGALYLDADDPATAISLAPPHPRLTYEKWLPSLVPQIGEVIGVIYGTEILQHAATVCITARENFIRASGQATEISLQDLYNAIPLVPDISSGRRSGYKEAVTTALGRVLSGSSTLFKCRKGIDLAELIRNHNVVLGTRSITDDFAARFLALFMLWYLHELDRFSAPGDDPKSALIIDDAHRYVGARSGFGADRTLSSLGSILTTLRSSGRCFVAVGQVPHMVDSGVLALMQTVVQVGALHHTSDTQLIARMMGLNEAQRLALSRLKQQEAIALCADAAWGAPVHCYVENVPDLRRPSHG
jgi:hypothetical protein